MYRLIKVFRTDFHEGKPHKPFNSHEWPRQNFSLQDWYKIKEISKENRPKFQLGDYKSIQFPILQRNTKRVAWQTVAWISNEILGVKGLWTWSINTLMSPYRLILKEESYKSERIIFFRFSVTYLPEPAANSFFFFQSNMKRHYPQKGENGEDVLWNDRVRVSRHLAARVITWFESWFSWSTLRRYERCLTPLLTRGGGIHHCRP